MALVLAVAGTLLAIGAPRAARWLDRAAVESAARRVTMAIAVARHRAVAWGTRTRLLIRPDVLTLDTLGADGWGQWATMPGALADGVTLEVTNPTITFAPNGVAWGFSNTRIVLRRGVQNATITVSRVGRVKRW
jgi:Tfp pilus assembly protein FimT